MMLYLLIELLFLLYYFNYVNGVTVNIIAYSNFEEYRVYNEIIYEFKNYLKNNNLDININLELFTPDNSTFEVDDYGSLLESVLLKKKQKYDILIHDNAHLSKVGPYLLDLNNYIPKENIDLYNPKVLSQGCTYKDKLIGLPLWVNYSVLYSNILYLNKYNKTAPKTWDELIETSKYIIEEEKKLNNIDLIGYNGAIDDSEMGTLSIYEFIYSFRDSIDSPFPELTSQNSINALKMLKKIKEEISSDEIFRMSIRKSPEILIQQKILFLKYTDADYIFPYFNLKAFLMPGYKKNISGTYLGGSNIGINAKSDMEKRESVLKVFNFFTSKNIQKLMVTKFKFNSGINSIYDDEKLCSEIDCDAYKNAQPIARPNTITKNYGEYSEKFRNYACEFLFGNKTAVEVLKAIDDITKIYYMSLEGENRTLVSLFLASIIIFEVFMVFSLIFLVFERYKPYFKFISNDFWIVIITGLLLIVYSGIFEIGEKKMTKCQLNLIFLIIGFSFVIIPILYQLIINFPDENKISNWISRHKYFFLFIFILLDITILSILLPSYRTKTIYIEEKENYKICELKDTLITNITYIALLIFKIFIILVILLLIYIEWNLYLIHYDIRYTLVFIYTYILYMIVLLITKYVNLNYIQYFIIYESSNLFSALCSYLCLYFIRIIWILFKKETGESKYIKDISKRSTNAEERNKFNSTFRSNSHDDQYGSNITKYSTRPSEAATFSSFTDNSSKISKNESFFLKLYNYHNIRE